MRLFVRLAALDSSAIRSDSSMEAVKCLVNFAIRAMEIEKADGGEASSSLVLKGWEERAVIVC